MASEDDPVPNDGIWSGRSRSKSCIIAGGNLSEHIECICALNDAS